MSSHFIAKCLDCGHTGTYFPTKGECPYCGSAWREAVYDYDTIKRSLQAQILNRPFNLWRYKELLPIRNPNPEITLGEGGTPLIRANNLGMMLGCPHIYIKDERQGPTGSFKDRQAAVTIATLKEAGVTEAVIASTGNVALSYSAYAARAGIKLWAFITSLVTPVKMREVAIYGTQVVKVTGNYDQAKKVAAEFANQRGLYIDHGVRSIPTVEAMKTLAFEISEQLTSILGAPKTKKGQASVPWQVPDWYIQSVSGGLGPVGVIKAYEELKLMNMVNSVPKIANVQAEGCSPMVAAWRDNKEEADPVMKPRTHIATLATGVPGRTYTLLREMMLRNQSGIFESVTDEEAYRAMHIVAKMEGISVEPATGVAFAGLIKLVRAGVIQPSDVIVINCSGHTVPVEQSVLGENWSHNVDLPKDTQDLFIPEDGLLAALNRVSPRYSKILIADDHPHVRRLIRRIMQAQGDYKLFEAKDGKEAVDMAFEVQPDLIILDLMMPEMDGFGVLDALRGNADTKNIPVIVVTAKELTKEEKDRLEGQIQSLMQKGDFMSDELMEEVRSLTEKE